MQRVWTNAGFGCMGWGAAGLNEGSARQDGRLADLLGDRSTLCAKELARAQANTRSKRVLGSPALGSYMDMWSPLKVHQPNASSDRSRCRPSKLGAGLPSPSGSGCARVPARSHR